jgi:hypothetical protein
VALWNAGNALSCVTFAGTKLNTNYTSRAGRQIPAGRSATMENNNTVSDEMFCTAENCFECVYFWRFKVCGPDVSAIFEGGATA